MLDATSYGVQDRIRAIDMIARIVLPSISKVCAIGSFIYHVYLFITIIVMAVVLFCCFFRSCVT